MRTLALIIVFFTAWTAHAQSDESIIFFGGSDAQLCYNAAERTASGTLDHCNSALKSRTLSRRHQIATLINRGIVFNHLGDYAAALADFEAALALDPNVSAAYVNRGNTYFYTQQFDLAVDNYSKSLQMNPRNPHIAHLNRGIAYEARREEGLAFADFVRANELRPEWEPAAIRVKQHREEGFEQSD